MLRILLVSIAFPPKSDPESLQVGRYTKYLIRNGCEIEVITSSNPTLYMESDPNLENISENVTAIYPIRLFENRYLNFLIRKTFPSLLQYPDSKWSFYFRNITKVRKPDLLYSRSYPLSSTLLALKLKKKWGCPWLLHLSDPWALSYEGDSPATDFKARPREWNKKRERECFAIADRISFTSTKTIELYNRKYPEFSNKFILTPNVFDEESVNTRRVKFSEKLNIVYTGGFGEKRDPTFYLETIDEFLKENPEIAKEMVFLFTGPMTRKNKLIFNKFNHIDQIIHLGVVSYNSMLEQQRDANVLVNIDTDILSSEHSVFFPSKLLEYFASNRRILTIGNDHSMTNAIIQGRYGDCVEFNDAQALKLCFKNYWEKFKAKDELFFTLKHSIEEYGADFNSKILLKEINNIIRGVPDRT